MGGGEHFPSGPYAVPLGEPNNVRHDLEREHEGERERELEREGERARGRGREREWGEEEEEEEEREREREREEERAREREREREEEERERERREPTIKGELVKIYPQANPRFYLTAEGDTVVLSKGEDDTPKEDQLWYKDDSTGDRVKDSEGHPAFVLVNKASHLALKHVADDRVQVSLATFREGAVDDSLLWTLSDDVGDGYRAIRPVNNTKLNLDADHADKEHGGVKEHNRLILFKWKKQDNQKWKLVPVTE